MPNITGKFHHRRRRRGQGPGGPKFREKIVFGQFSCKIRAFSGKKHAKLGNFDNFRPNIIKKFGYFDNFSDKNRVKFAHFVNFFSYIFFGQKCRAP